MGNQVKRPGPELTEVLLHVICPQPARVNNPHFVSSRQNPAWEAPPGVSRAQGAGTPAHSVSSPQSNCCHRCGHH